MEQEVSISLPVHALPWEGQHPECVVYGFKQAVGNIEVALGYAVYPQAVLLFSTLQFPGQTPNKWRQYWTTHVDAVAQAEQLCDDSMEYLESFNAPMRPVEDLDYDDFLEHLSSRINNNLH